MALLAVVAYLTVRPCGYCLATLAVVFLSTSPSSPFLAALSPETLTPAPPAAPQPLQLTDPIPDRGAFYTNGGRWFDPCLVGYEQMRQVWVEAPQETPADNYTTATTTPAEAHPSDDTAEIASAAEPISDSDPKQPSHWPGRWKFGLSTSMFSSQPRRRDTAKEARRDTSAKDADIPPLPSYPKTPPARPLPPGYLDLRIGGVGLVLDIGWKRTKEGLSWELEDNEYAAELARYRRAERQVRRKRAAVEREQSTSSNWRGASFLGSW